MMYPIPSCLNSMQRALISPAPVVLECGVDAERVRQRCYRIRQRHWEQGDVRFAFLRFRIRGSVLVIDRQPDGAAIERRLRFRILREAFAWAREQRACLERPGSQNISADNQE